MKFNIQFINFPKSDLMRESVSNRIQNCFDKFAANATSIKAYLSADGVQHHVKISLKSTKLSACINATATNMGSTIEKAIQKLESFLRKVSSKNKNKKNNLLLKSPLIETTHNGKRTPYKTDNVFYLYERAYKKEFDSF